MAKNEAAATQAPCEFCKRDYSETRVGENGHHLIVDGQMWWHKIFIGSFALDEGRNTADWLHVELPFSFCPACGRRIEEE